MALLSNTVVFQTVIQGLVGCSVGGLLGDVAHNSRPWTERKRRRRLEGRPQERSESQRLRSIKNNNVMKQVLFYKNIVCKEKTLDEQ